MSLLSQAKREAKRVFNELSELSKIKENLDYLEIRNFFYKIKGFKDYSSFEQFNQKDMKLLSSSELLENNHLSFVFDKNKLLLKNDINIIPLNVTQIPPTSAPPQICLTEEISIQKNLLLLDNSMEILNKYVKQKHTILITDEKNFSNINSKILSLNTNKVSIDPLTPLIGDIFSIKYFFGADIYLWVNEILCLIKEDDKTIDIKNLEPLFYLPQLIETNTLLPNNSYLNKYLINLFKNVEIHEKNINSTILENHYLNCSKGLIFAKILQSYECFQSKPNCNFYTYNESLSVLLNNDTELDTITSKIILHNIFKCTELIHNPYSSIIVNCSLSYLNDINNHQINKVIFAPNLEDFLIKEYYHIKNTIFLSSEVFLINLSIPLEQKYLPYSFIDKVVDIDHYPVEYRKCEKFSDLKINEILYFKFSQHYKNKIFKLISKNNF